LPSPGLEPTFESIRKNIIEPKCLQCHKPDGKAEDYLFDSQEDMINSSDKLIVPGEPEKSLFYRALFADAKRPMPPKRTGNFPLSPKEIDTIRDWIISL
jgi:hypothetical protein